ncbi:hypothetical protein P692DRAFT_20878418 [Suillus brevipes Sb2]|nr:hypothetical protein P692DRAFT_20878418 [Suillus brevipes Sb2]
MSKVFSKHSRLQTKAKRGQRGASNRLSRAIEAKAKVKARFGLQRLCGKASTPSRTSASGPRKTQRKLRLPPSPSAGRGQRKRSSNGYLADSNVRSVAYCASQSSASASMSDEQPGFASRSPDEGAKKTEIPNGGWCNSKRLVAPSLLVVPAIAFATFYLCGVQISPHSCMQNLFDCTFGQF